FWIRIKTRPVKTFLLADGKCILSLQSFIEQFPPGNDVCKQFGYAMSIRDGAFQSYFRCYILKLFLNRISIPRVSVIDAFHLPNKFVNFFCSHHVFVFKLEVFM